MWERCTERAKRVIGGAREEAARLGSEYVYTEHILLGLCREPDGIAARALSNLGVKIEALACEIEQQAPPGKWVVPLDAIPFTPGARKVLELAVEVARHFNHSYIGTEHILLGLLKEGEGIATKVLHNMKIDMVRTQAEVIHLLDDQKGRPSMWGRFNEHAKHVVTAARAEATRLGSEYVRTEHILLGLCREPEGIAARTLVNLGANIEALVSEIERQVQPGTKVISGDDIAFTPRAKNVLELAVIEARRFDHSYIGTEHILIGLLKEGEGIAVKVLQDMKIDLGNIQAEVIRLLGDLKGRPSAWERFTQHAKHVIIAAREEAERLGSKYVCSEHILLGLCREPEGIVARALENLEIDIEALVTEIAQQAQPGAAIVSEGNIAFTPRAMKVLEFARQEARSFKHNRIGTEHILLGLLQEGDGIGAKVFQEMKIDVDRVEAEVIRLLGGQGPKVPNVRVSSHLTLTWSYALGSTESPCLVFLHGFLGSAQDWLPVSASLSDSYHCLLFDLPGHGHTRSSRSFPPTPASIASALADVLRIAHIEPHAIIGYSMGGRLALQFAVDFPASAPRLILESASPGLETEPAREHRVRHDEKLAARLDCIGADRAAFRRFLREWYEQPLFASLSEVQRADLVESRLQGSPRQLAAALRAFSTGAQANLWPELPALRPRTLLITGGLDTKFTGIARDMQQRAPHLHHEIFPNCGHNVHLEDPAGYTKALQDFLAKT